MSLLPFRGTEDANENVLATAEVLKENEDVGHLFYQRPFIGDEESVMANVTLSDVPTFIKA